MKFFALLLTLINTTAFAQTQCFERLYENESKTYTVKANSDGVEVDFRILWAKATYNPVVGDAQTMQASELRFDIKLRDPVTQEENTYKIKFYGTYKGPLLTTHRSDGEASEKITISERKGVNPFRFAGTQLQMTRYRRDDDGEDYDYADQILISADVFDLRLTDCN